MIHGAILLICNVTEGLQEAKALERIGTAGCPRRECQIAPSEKEPVVTNARGGDEEENSYRPSLSQPLRRIFLVT